MGGSEHEAIRDDHFYTSLLLGCRRASTASISPGAAAISSASSASASPGDKRSVVATKTTPPLIGEAVPQPSFRGVGGSPDAGTATSAGDSTPTVSPSTCKSGDSDANKRHGPKRSKRNEEPSLALLRTSSTEEEGDERDSSRWTARYATGSRDAASTPTSAPWSSSASVAGSAPGSVDNSPKQEGEDASGEPQRKTKRRFRKATHTIRKVPDVLQALASV